MRRLSVPDTQSIGGLFITIHKFVYSKENIPKISTPVKLTLSIHTIQILNKPIQPILWIHLHMPTHTKDLHLIQDIRNHIKEVTEK